MKSQLFGSEHAEAQVAAGEKFVLQNERMLKIALSGEVYARQGSMVAYQGQMDFDFEGGGVGKFLKKMVTGEGLPLMKVTGSGDLFLAEDAQEVHLLYLENESVTVEGRNLLAFDSGLTWDVKRVQGLGAMLGGAGLFNTVMTGTGWLALVSHGTPVMLQTDQPTYVDVQSAIAWSANLVPTINRTMKAKALIGRGSGEVAQYAFQGQGWVIVQASEGVRYMAPSAG